MTANRLDALVRAGDLLGRLGGDEFALLLTAVPVLGDRAAADGPRAAPGPRDRRTAGRADRGGRRTDVDRGLGRGGGGRRRRRRPDRAAAPGRHRDVPGQEGGGSVAAYDGARDAASTDQLALLAELREALAVDDQLVLALQPAVDLATGRPTGVEALIRWQHPRRGLAQPGRLHPTGGEQRAARRRSPATCSTKALGVAASWAAGGAGRAGLGQPLGAQPARPAAAGGDRRARCAATGAAAPARSGDHRDGGDERAGGHRRGAGRRCAVDGRAARRRRLRHRLLVADLPHPDRRRRVEGRPLLRDRGWPTRRRPRRSSGRRSASAHELGLRVVAEGWRPPSSGRPWPSWAAPPRRATTSSSRCRPTRSARCWRSLRDSAESNVFRLRADGAS